MQITYKAGRFHATDAVDPIAMQAAGWRWDKMKMAWIVADREKAAPFAAHAIGDAKTRIDAFIQARHDAVKDSFALDADIDVPVPDGCTIRPYQAAGVAYMVKRKNVLNADAPRLGKTIQTICTANAAYPCPGGSAFQKLRILIVCPANAKINWHREWQKWNTLPHLTHGIISGSDNPQTDVLIINYDILSRHYDYLSSIVWDIVVFDEAHRLKNEQSARTRYCIGDGSTAHPGLAFSRLRIFLTGTPIKTRPIDLWPILKACDPQGLGKNRWGFAERYCDAKKVNGVWDMSGASNMEELQRRLRQTFMIRREKHEVVKEVPSNRQTIILPQAGLTKLLASERDAIGALVDDFEAALLNLEGSLDRLSRLDGIVRDDDGGGSEALSTVRQELALAKLDMCFEHMDELLAAEDKIVVFAYHRAVVKKMYERFSETHGAVMVIGGLTETARQKAIDDFKTDPTRRVMVANLISAGEAIDLSVADVACFVEISWVPADLDQAEERIWAVTKERPVSIYKYVVEDSMDDIMLRVVEGRQKNIALAMNREYMAA